MPPMSPKTAVTIVALNLFSLGMYHAVYTTLYWWFTRA